MTNHLQDRSFMSRISCFPPEQEHICHEAQRNMSFLAECIFLLKLQDEHNVTTLLGVSLSLIHQAEQHFLICRKSAICELVGSLFIESHSKLKGSRFHFSKGIFFSHSHYQVFTYWSLLLFVFMILFSDFCSVVQYSVIPLVRIPDSSLQFSSVVFTFQLLTPEISPPFHTLTAASDWAVAVGD